jgi:hypothetical protein
MLLLTLHFTITATGFLLLYGNIILHGLELKKTPKVQNTLKKKKKRRVSRETQIQQRRKNK